MNRGTVLKIADYIPLVILAVSALLLLAEILYGNTFFMWKHIIGLILLPVNILLFFSHHKIAVLVFGATLLPGLFSLLSFSPAINTTTLYVGSILFFMASRYFYYGS